MKKCLLLISLLFAPVITLTGCATQGDLEKLQAEERLNAAKADQAIQDAQSAKAAADEAKAKADAAATRADTAVKAAEERERIADEKAKKADAAFQKSMRK